jgi:predicted nucleotidyltransferase
MRLTQKQLNEIQKSFLTHFLPEDKIWLFGSRVDDTQKGGDIDFYIETHYPNLDTAIEKKIAFLRDLKMAIGDQRIDVVLNVLNRNQQQRIYEEAKNTGVQLI